MQTLENLYAPTLEVVNHQSSTAWIYFDLNYCKFLECDQRKMRASNTELVCIVDASPILHLHLLMPLQSKMVACHRHKDDKVPSVHIPPNSERWCYSVTPLPHKRSIYTKLLSQFAVIYVLVFHSWRNACPWPEPILQGL